MPNYEKGNVVTAIVSGITDYGVFVKIDDEYNGLIHISEISDKFVKHPKYFVEINEIIKVEILDIDEKNKQLKLSIKNNPYRKNGKKRKKIIETRNGFNTLATKLPMWIEQNINVNEDKKV